MPSIIMITATITAMMVICVNSIPVSSDEYHNEKELRVGTSEEEVQRIIKDCDTEFAAVKAHPVIATVQKMFEGSSKKVDGKNYEKVLRNFVKICQWFGANEPAPEEKHFDSIKASIKPDWVDI
uniref:Secreted protein n=1 Tax=Romanomermis culicivorax TaxID=13658 RepID=A0A915JP13_ROMCU